MRDSLRLLLDGAEPAQSTMIRELARPLGLLWRCPCLHEGTDSEDVCGSCGMPRGADLYDPAPGTEYTYPLSDYARQTARSLGKGWGCESGYIGAYGVIWGPGEGGQVTLLLHVIPGDEGGLVVQLKDDPFAEAHEVELPDGAPHDEEGLKAVARRVASVIRLAYT